MLLTDSPRCIGRDDPECTDCTKRLTPSDAHSMVGVYIVTPPDRIKLTSGQHAGLLACPERRSVGAHRPATVWAADSEGVGAVAHAANVRPPETCGNPANVGTAVSASAPMGGAA